MLELYDKSFNRVAILQNAFNVIETEKINAVSEIAFSLPDTDPKNELCEPFYHVRYDGGELYRIASSVATESEDGLITYRCEHAIITLIDTLMFGWVQVGGLGYYSTSVIEYVLNRQPVKNWVLGECHFRHQFEYGWEQENLLGALFSIPTRFVDKYIWKFDTTVYPFKVSLKRIDESASPQHYLRKGHNRLRLVNQSDPRNICTRLYALGAGEGVNQLGISEINGGLPYLQSPQPYVDKYGIVERALIDRRYTDQQSLKNAAQAMLNDLQEPTVEYSAKYNGSCKLGDIVEIVDVNKSYVVEVITRHGEVPDVDIKIANRPKDIAGSIADLADRQRIESVYSQGATQFFQDSKWDNATPDVPLTYKLFIPSDLEVVNFIMADVDMGPFRKPFTVTGGAGGTTISQINTTSSGASSTTTTNSGGGDTSGPSSRETTLSGGDDVITSENSPAIGESTEEGGGEEETSGEVTLDTSYTEKIRDPYGPANHDHGLLYGDVILVNVEIRNGGIASWESRGYTPAGAHTHGAHRHTFELPYHRHDFELPKHYHEIDLPGHTHRMDHTHTTKAHSHGMAHTHNIAHTHTIGDHTHILNAGITFQGNPTSLRLVVDGVQKAFINAKTFQQDISDYLLNSARELPRDRYITIELYPNDLAYIQLTLSFKGFIQSRGDRRL